jgi:hypothetical protein
MLYMSRPNQHRTHQDGGVLKSSLPARSLWEARDAPWLERTFETDFSESLPAGEPSGPCGGRGLRGSTVLKYLYPYSASVMEMSRMTLPTAQEMASSMAITFGSRPVQSFCASTP